MDDITAFSYKGGNGFRPSGNGFRLAVFSFLWCFTFFVANYVAAPAHAAQALNRGLEGGYSPGLLPISLGKAPGCPWPSGNAINNGTYPDTLIVAGGMWCGDGTYDLPYQWQGGAWSPLSLPGDAEQASGYAMSVSDSGGTTTFVYRLWTGGDTEDFYVVSPGQDPIKLETLPDAVQGNSAALSSSGNHVVGGNQIGDWETGFTHRAVVWTREAEGWSAAEDLAAGVAVAASDNGSIIIGNSDPWSGSYDAGPWVWEAGAAGGSLTMLEPEAAVRDITHDGSMIVGSRPEPCSNPEKCDFFPAPVYWLQEDGAWVMHDLEALDGVTSVAEAVAVVDGSPIIAGTGFTKQGGILRPVVWIPTDDGTYGAPIRLEALGGQFNSWSAAVDINRNGLVLGSSELAPYFGYEIVIWSLFEPLPFQINTGISDAWYNPDTDGQGFFINVWENIQTMFVGWYTYSDVGANGSGHYWMTAQGPYTDNRAELDITLTTGGAFDSGVPAPIRSVAGTMTIEFSDCLQGTVTYDIPSLGQQGTVPIQRLAKDHIVNCEYSAAQPAR